MSKLFTENTLVKVIKMKTDYKVLGNYIRLIDERNKNLSITNLQGVSITKKFIPSIANIVGTDLSNYKIVRTGQFAYGPVTSRNGEKISIAYLEGEDCIISSSYTVFEVENKEELNPEYLMLWFSRPEFDRYARYKSHGSVREIFDWNELCMIELPVPTIEEQRNIVKAYKTIIGRIALKQKVNDNLEMTLLTVYKEKIANNHEVRTMISLNNACIQITDGKHGDCESENNSGYYFISVKDISNGCIDFNNARQITKNDFIETHKRTNLEVGDILFTNSGTLGKMCLITSADYASRTTFQKSVAILKPEKSIISSMFLYLSLAFYKDKLIEYAHGSAQKNLLLGDIRIFEIKYPSKQLMVEIDSLGSPMFMRVQQNNNEIIYLKKLIDILLTKLNY